MRKTQKRGLKLLYPLLNGDLLKGHTHMVQYLCAHAAPLLSDEFELDVIESALMRGKVQVLRVLFKDKRYDLASFIIIIIYFGALCESTYHYGGVWEWKVMLHVLLMTKVWTHAFIFCRRHTQLCDYVSNKPFSFYHMQIASSSTLMILYVSNKPFSFYHYANISFKQHFDDTLCATAAENGQLESLMFLRSLELPWDVDSILHACALNGRLVCAQP